MELPVDHEAYAEYCKATQCNQSEFIEPLEVKLVNAYQCVRCGTLHLTELDAHNCSIKHNTNAHIVSLMFHQGEWCPYMISLEFEGGFHRNYRLDY